MKFIKLLAVLFSSTQAITIDKAANITNIYKTEAKTEVLDFQFTDRFMNDTALYPDGLRWDHTP
jgi:hypothetical protein